MLSKFLKLFTGHNTNVNSQVKSSIPKIIKPSTTSNSYTATGFDGVVDGIKFSPTFLLITPCEVLRADGMILKNEKEIPDFLKDPSQGVWLPRLKRESSFNGSRDVGASDAYGANRIDYIAYVCSVKDIYASRGNIFERVKLIDQFKKENPNLLYVEEKLLKHYENYTSIIDILMLRIYFSFEDLVLFHYQDKGYLNQMLEVNARIEQSLIDSGYETVEDIASLSKDQLVKLNGVGNKSAEKILDKINEINMLITTRQ